MDLKIINADVYAGLSYLNNNSIDCAITSPPYWGQRDYGFDGQIGNENTYMQYISKLVVVYNKLKDKLSEKGIFFLNIGDKYISKYGKSPLGLIPYKLAYFMAKDGWVLNDTLIWYKPNHMPSSIKNRFTNTYEPVFVFSKSKNNYYTENTNKKSKILKIKVQLTSYKHVATYPERLVEELLLLLNLPKEGVVLDPFAGSGTTGKAVININEKLIYNKNLSCVMIERFEEFVNIIKERCNIISNKNIAKVPFLYYDIPDIKEPDIDKINIDNNYTNEMEEKRGLVTITENKEGYLKILQLFYNKSIKEKLRSDSTIFIGSKNFDIETIYKTSLLNNNGWVVRNMLIVAYNNSYYPVFMIVDNNKKYNYLFNFEKIQVKHKHNNDTNWKSIDFKNMKVYDKFHKEKREGIIIDIVEYHSNHFPKWVNILWNDNSVSKEYVIYDDEMDGKIDLLCSNCNNKININNYDPFKENKCSNCGLIFWKDMVPKFKEKEIINGSVYENKITIEQGLDYNHISKTVNNNKNYNGKFKNISNKINLGASPGARASTQEECFTVKRLYNVNQSFVCDYLNYKRLEKKLSKKALTDLFPSSYKHTVGHWLRKDFVGSLPLPSDWKILDEILNFDKTITNYTCKIGIKLQTIKALSKGKNIGDCLFNFNGNIKSFLEKIYSL